MSSATTSTTTTPAAPSAVDADSDDVDVVDVVDELEGLLPTYEDVVEASRILQGVANVTPIKTSRTLNEQLSQLLLLSSSSRTSQREEEEESEEEGNNDDGGQQDLEGGGIQVYLKCENEQRIGAFKFRGAYNALYHAYHAMMQRQQKDRKKRKHQAVNNDNGDGEGDKDIQDGSSPGDNVGLHVITFSSGNHAQAIALAARLFAQQQKNCVCKATIIMPNDAPILKINATKGYGGNIIFYDRYKEDRNAIAQQILDNENGGKNESSSSSMSSSTTTTTTTRCVMIPPYNDKYVIAGQGTVGKEFFDEIPNLDYLFVCVGGGGLISGCCLAAAANATLNGSKCKVIGVEPCNGNDAQLSLQQNSIYKIEDASTIQTIADGAQTQCLGDITFALMKRHVHSIITVTDDELVSEMKFLGERMKMIVEPTGCLGLAGLRKYIKEEGNTIPKNSKCGVVISGGNVDLQRYTELLSKTF